MDLLSPSYGTPLVVLMIFVRYLLCIFLLSYLSSVEGGELTGSLMFPSVTFANMGFRGSSGETFEFLGASHMMSVRQSSGEVFRCSFYRCLFYFLFRFVFIPYLPRIVLVPVIVMIVFLAVQ